MTLKGDFGELTFNVLTRKTMDSNDFWEENWLYSNVNGSFPGFAVDFNFYIRVDELKRCYDEVWSMILNKRDEAKLSTLEESVMAYFVRDYAGHIQVNGTLKAIDLTGCCLMFNFDIDNMGLEKFAFQLKAVLDNYPIKGSP